MDFNANTKLNFNVGGAITVSGMAKASMGNNNITYNYDEIDYEEPSAFDVYFDIKQEMREKLVYDLFDTKYLTKTAAYIFFKNPKATSTFISGVYQFVFPQGDSEFLKPIAGFFKGFEGKTTIVSFGTKALTVNNSCISAGVVKVLLGLITGDITNLDQVASTFGSAASKEYMKGLMNTGFDTILANTYGKVLAKAGLDLDVVKNVFKVAGSATGTLKQEGIRKLFFKNISYTQMNMLGGTAIDYVASVASSAVGALIEKGTVDWSDLRLGKNLLVSAYKTIFGLAFEKMFAFAGPAGQALGKQIGTIVGASIGGFWSSKFNEDRGAFTSEEWLGIAGAATIVGAVGGLWAGAAIAAGVSATIPVAGWIVGSAIIVGATAATAVIYVWYWLSGKG